MPEPINGTLTVDTDDKFMTAHLIVYEPEFGGKPVTYQQVCDELTLKNIRHNVDFDAIKNVFEDNIFGKSVLVAKGDSPVDGENGKVLYHFKQSDAQEFKEDKYGNVDYHDLGLIHNIVEGTIIAEIIPETTGTPGKDVRGIEIPQRPGNPPVYSIGTGVKASADGFILFAGISGNLKWTKNQFVVEKDVTISGDVDVSVGNIDFIGDVIVRGNVEEGYEIKSGGNITIFGSVTGAKITAAGNVAIHMGVVSSEVSGVDVSASFFENSDINANGKLTAQNFIACQAMCAGKLTASGGKAAIIGGKYTSLSDIEANIIGSDTYTRTLLVLGNTAVLTEERVELMKKIDEFENQIDQLGKICSALQLQKKAAPLTEDREEMLVTSIRAKYVHQRELKAMKQRVLDIDKEIDISNDLKVVVRRSLFPGVSVRINGLRHNVANVNGQCTVRVGNSGDIEIK